MNNTTQTATDLDDEDRTLPIPFVTNVELVRNDPPGATQEAHDATPTCNAARGAHWTAHTLACRAMRDLVNVQRKAGS